ncbi:hypothetical protein SAMN05216404_12232 [Nitrosospira multiformis]|uniref:Uncharacterized protein n=1 Tax=Nitrosospira multiformis TaxID=1231 RepID=A0A1H8PRR4_9PROT|nr:hypothetical protein SAMN05216404_12232 [Nitrosospira multiformis]
MLQNRVVKIFFRFLDFMIDVLTRKHELGRRLKKEGMGSRTKAHLGWEACAPTSPCYCSPGMHDPLMVLIPRMEWIHEY